RQSGDGRVRLTLAADPDDVAAAATVVEVAVNAVREVGAGHEVAESGPELRPVGNEHWLVELALVGKAHKSRDRCAHSLDWLAGARQLFDVNAGRKICCCH